jgi:hypothetical protein
MNLLSLSVIVLLLSHVRVHLKLRMIRAVATFHIYIQVL